MGEIRPKTCEGRELTKDQLARVALPGGGEARYTYVYEQCEWKPETREQQAAAPSPHSENRQG
eukprot:COSAG04_NODE_3063_length_3213_cov_2.861316_5_plen_63_part_00